MGVLMLLLLMAVLLGATLLALLVVPVIAYEVEVCSNSSYPTTLLLQPDVATMGHAGCIFHLVGLRAVATRCRCPPFVDVHGAMAFVFSLCSRVCFGMLEDGLFDGARPKLEHFIVVVCLQCCLELFLLAIEVLIHGGM